MAIYNIHFLSESLTLNESKLYDGLKNYKRYGYVDHRGVYNAVIEIDGKKYRERSEVLCMSSDHKMVYIGLDDHNKYSIPGGGLDKGETPVKACKRELSEEALIVGKNFKFCESYITEYSKVPKWLIDNIPEKEQWIGHYTHLFICDYSREFKGNVDDIDRDVLYDTGKFVPVKDAIKKLNEYQIKYLK